MNPTALLRWVGRSLPIVCCVWLQPGTAHEAIPASYQRIAAEHHLPPAVLYSVAMTESGRTLPNGQVRPWPWTLNVAGLPKRYPTRLAAWQGLTAYLKQGIDLIDIGLMQVNWRYHRQQLGSPWQALEPFNNTRTGAKILQSHYQQTGTWPSAIGRYHSPGAKPAQRHRAKQYAQRVIKQMARVQGGPNVLGSEGY